MNRLRTLRRELFDIRPGEHSRTWFMFFYLLFVLFAYYILKPVSRSMFLTKFDVDKLPWLYILIAAFGGLLAYLYSKLAARSSLASAVFWTMVISVASLAVMWAFIGFPWMVYVLNIWVSLFSIVLVSQGWLVASNLFDAREAKRLYPLLGMGMVIGAAFGGEFTNRTALLVGTRNLLLASSVLVVLAYLSFRLAIRSAPAELHHARAGDKKETEFSFGGIVRDISHLRHLQTIIAIMVVMYLVDTLVEYQFQVSARTSYKGDHLTAFFGQFYGLYLNVTEFALQLLLTSAVVRRFGVGGTLQIAPVSIALASIATAASPGVLASGGVRLAEAATRYTFNRTGMELLYMPLPGEVRNRIKAFIDICVDRLSRGVAGVLLLLMTTTALNLGVQGISVVVMALCIPWIYVSYLARREYVASVRKRFEARQLDFEASRLAVNDPATLVFLEETARGDSPRQAAYALSLLAQAPGYDVRPLLSTLGESRHETIRDKAYEIAAQLHWDGLLARASRERDERARSAVPYILAVTPDREAVAESLMNDANPEVVAGALTALEGHRDLAQRIVTKEWLDRAVAAADPQMRARAATAIGARGDEGLGGLLEALLHDSDPEVVRSACRAAGALRNPAYTWELVGQLENSRVQGEAIGALSRYGDPVCQTLSAVLLDERQAPRVRRRVPRVLRKIGTQRAVDVLLKGIALTDLNVRTAALKGLNRLREDAPGLDFDGRFLTAQILSEARYYFELSAALAPFRGIGDGRPAVRLLVRSIQERLAGSLERLFRMLGLQYPPKEIYSVYRAIAHREHEAAAAALEFLDNTLDPALKRTLLPILDAPEHVLERGRELFGVKSRTAQDAVREIIRSEDPWLRICATAAAAELGMRSLVPDIASAAQGAGGDFELVARAAGASLAAQETAWPS